MCQVWMACRAAAVCLQRGHNGGWQGQQAVCAGAHPGCPTQQCIQSGRLSAAVKSSLITPVFKKGDESDTSNYRPIAVGEPLCRLYAAILNSRIVNWAKTNGLHAPCQAGFRPRLSTEHQLFALRHFIDRSKSQKQPLFAAFVDLKKAYDSVQHPLLWAALQRKGIHGKMLAGIQSSYDGGDMSMKISGSSGSSGTARVGVRQGCPLSPTLFGIFLDSLDAHLQAESAAAGVECRGVRVPGLFYADDVALLSPSAQGLQQLLDTMQLFCVANGLTISVLKTEVVVFGGGHQQRQWHVGGHRLERSESFIDLGMLFHEDRHIKHALQHCLARGYAAQGSILSRYTGLGCANSVQLLVRLQQAILQPCASYACEVWAPASACIGPFKPLPSQNTRCSRRHMKWQGHALDLHMKSRRPPKHAQQACAILSWHVHSTPHRIGILSRCLLQVSRIIGRIPQACCHV